MALNSKQYLKVQNTVDKLVTFSNDSLEGSRVIRAFNKQEETKSKFDSLSFDYFKETKKANFINALVNPLTLLIVDIGIVLIIYFGGNLIYKGDLTDGDVVALISYLNQIFMALIVVTNLVVIFTKAISSKKRIDNVLIMNEPKIKDDALKNLKINKGEPLIEFKNVSFRYNDSSNNVISNIDFKINKGETIGIIGGTGSGKTSIIKLIERFFDASEGKILYKGYDIKDYDLRCLRDEISGMTFMTGDKVRVKCVRADVNSGNIDFELCQN